MTFHPDGTLPTNGEVFVFGSNLAGRHGAGAAKVAAEQFGAEYGIGKGFVGNSYAIATKDQTLRVLPLDQIARHVRNFLTFAYNSGRFTPHRRFFVTRVGCGLAGYADIEIAPLFRGAPDTCSFAEEWREYL